MGIILWGGSRKGMINMALKADLKKDMPTDKYCLFIRIGSICCALVLRNLKDYHEGQKLYREFITEGPADITIELEVTDRVNPENLEEVLYDTVYTHNGGRFWTTSQIVSGQYDLSSSIVNITAERKLGDANFEFNHLNRLITTAYFSGCKIKYNGGGPPAMLMHACGIVRNGKAILFTGPSEIGKSTIARLCGDIHGEVINDEMVLVSRPGRGDNGISALGAPILGEVSRRNISAPLSCILMLKQSSETKVNTLDKTDAYLRLIRQVINPAYIGQKSGREVYSLMADFSSEMTEHVPVYELEFQLDRNKLWRTVERLESALENGEWK